MRFCSNCGSVLTRREIDGESRFLCTNESCQTVSWNNPIPVVAALVCCDGRYLLARNTRWPKKIFSVITGYLEAHEVPEQAVLREVKEELGLDGEVKQFIGHYMFREKNQLIICYEVEAKGRLITNDEIAEVKALTAAELLAYNFAPLYITEKIVGDWATKNSLS